MKTEPIATRPRRPRASERIEAASKRLLEMNSDDSRSAIWRLIGHLTVMSKASVIRSSELADTFDRVSGAEEVR